jgi:hypothetical protein
LDLDILCEEVEDGGAHEEDGDEGNTLRTWVVFFPLSYPAPRLQYHTTTSTTCPDHRNESSSRVCTSRVFPPKAVLF